MSRKRTNLHGLSKSPLYDIWKQMHARCYNPKRHLFAKYGGRGITICDRWLNSFETFLTDMGERPAGAQIDRINNDAGYSPENCRWATRAEQARNRSNNVFVEYRGVRMIVGDAIRASGSTMSHFGVTDRLKRGMSIEEALTTPSGMLPRRPYRTRKRIAAELDLARTGT